MNRNTENVVRKAVTLKTLDELNVSSRTRTCLKKKFDSIEDVVKYGRIAAYNGVATPKWELELVEALEEAGFIRPKADFTISFRIGLLYWSIFEENRECFILQIEQLSNEQYESFVSVSDEDIESVKLSLRNRLKEREYDVICRRFGLEGNEDWDLDSVAQYFQTTRMHISQIEAKAFWKLKGRNDLPALFDAQDELNDVVNSFKNELDELYKTPVFEREQELLMGLRHMGKMPLKYYDGTGKQINLNVFCSLSIEKLDLSVRLCNCLKCAGINTAYDVIRYPKDVLAKITTRSELEELVGAILQSTGYDIGI